MTTARTIIGLQPGAAYREIDADVALILVSALEPDVRRQLELTINGHFSYPIQLENLVKASKKALGDKISYEIGMQFFDALFGMQMCTHRDLHQRTFDHVIRTTKVYGKFLLYLNARGYLHLTSWALKNCLMASLVHDIGKLLVMHGVLYKDGKTDRLRIPADQASSVELNHRTARRSGY
jgi:response regulator RpfG family c-di-GMP phosphodiesterase